MKSCRNCMKHYDEEWSHYNPGTAGQNPIPKCHFGFNRNEQNWGVDDIANKCKHFEPTTPPQQE